jgi:hypothetical protein
MAAMPIPREDLMRLLIEIEQQLAELCEMVDGLDIQSDEAGDALARMVCLEAARKMVEEKLNVGQTPEQPDWETILTLCNMPEEWPK